MVDIHYPTAEIRREKEKKKERRKKKPHCKNIMSASATQGGHNEKELQLELIRREDSESELLRSAPGSYPNSLK